MNYQSQMQFTVQSAAGLEIRQQLSRRKSLELPGGSGLWFAVSKVVSILLIVMVGLTFWMQSMVSDTYAHIQNTEAQHFEIRNEQMALLAERARLMSESYIQNQAQVELALFVPEKGQIHKLR